MPPPTEESDLTIEISDAQTHLPGLDVRRLAGLAARVLRAEGLDRAEVSIAIVDDPTIRELNRLHLGHDWATDVISFVLSEPGDTLSGEVVVSAETAVASARRDGLDAGTELMLYLVHGLLHLCGHDDLTEAGASAMRRREGELLAGEGLSHPFSPALASTREGATWPT